MEREARKSRAKDLFESPWLPNTERELHECIVALQSSPSPEVKASMKALREILEDKLKNNHRNLGTLECEEACPKKRLRRLGLLRMEDMVKSLFEPLPLARARQTEDEDEDELFGYTPVVIELRIT